jgi:hypothetical protein
MRKYLIGGALFIAVILLLCGIAITKLVLNYNERRVINNNIANNRHALLCETLKPGMSISEVSDILNGTGNVIIRVAIESVHNRQYSILFTDKKEKDLYGGWIQLNFPEGKYNGAYVEGFDYIEEICDFGL